jgi:hypothetical protein
MKRLSVFVVKATECLRDKKGSSKGRIMPLGRWLRVGDSSFFAPKSLLLSLPCSMTHF